MKQFLAVIALFLTINLYGQDLVELNPAYQGVWDLRAVADPGEEAKTTRIPGVARATGTRLILQNGSLINFTKIATWEDETRKDANLVVTDTGRIIIIWKGWDANVIIAEWRDMDANLINTWAIQLRK